MSKTVISEENELVIKKLPVKREKTEVESCTSSQGQTRNKNKLGNVHPELPTEIQWRRHIRKDRNYLETGRKGKVVRGTDPASRVRWLKKKKKRVGRDL